MKNVMFMMLFVAWVSVAFAQEPSLMLSGKPGWHKIGEVKADFTIEDQAIAVLGNDRFSAILLKVTDAPINILSLEVSYENGQSETFDVKNELKAGAETRKIDFKGGSQQIKQVKFKYKTLPNQKDEKAHVELYGLKK